MDETPKRYYSIAEVAEALGVSKSLIRFWETKFPQLRPSKNSKGDRRFTPDHFALIRNIYELVKVRGFTLEGAKKELARQREKKVRLQELKAMRDFLKQLKERL
ncbi:MAG: MerR family transcriptional regulator [Saprospiraceae bacterium]|nr:MerR family transcriptional regulator [Saprospiraceae bacterium]